MNVSGEWAGGRNTNTFGEISGVKVETTINLTFSCRPDENSSVFSGAVLRFA
jgi:hypothetical protein